MSQFPVTIGVLMGEQLHRHRETGGWSKLIQVIY